MYKLFLSATKKLVDRMININVNVYINNSSCRSKRMHP